MRPKISGQGVDVLHRESQASFRGPDPVGFCRAYTMIWIASSASIRAVFVGRMLDAIV
jgi:hypothetical protein